MNRWLAALFSLPFMTACASASAPLRVACVGDSITYGDKLSNRETQSYPAVLAQLAGGRFRSGNFGVNGATALSGTGRAWTDTPACRDALAFAPDIVVVMLGINDLAFPNGYVRYPADLETIVRRFQALPSAPHVWLCTLTPIAPAEAQESANRTIREILIPAIRATAARTGAGVIDIAATYPNRLDLLPDGLHPTPAGAELLARTVLAALDAPAPAAPQIQPAPAAGPVNLSIRNEALAAKARADLWRKTRPALAELRDPCAYGDPAALLPLLADNTAAGPDLFFSFAALACALDRAGETTVFLPDGRPVAWREALLHQLVQRQKIDARGGGFWDATGTDADRDTAYALQALALALGP